MRVLLASAELSPLVKAGGLGDAVAGLRGALIRAGLDVETVIPDYRGWRLDKSEPQPLDVPEWAAPASAHRGRMADGSRLTLIDVPEIRRPHPYDDTEGHAFPDNDQRFMAFAAAVAALAEMDPPDILHLNDWHTGPILGFLDEPPPSILTIHNLAYQGRINGGWLDDLPHRADAYEWFGDLNPLSGAIALADRVTTVSPTFASEIVVDGNGFGLEEPLRNRGSALVGILNGLDTEVWNPANDRLLDHSFGLGQLDGKAHLRAELVDRLGWHLDGPLISMVTRITDQKGIDIALSVVPYLDGIGARFALLGSGDAALAAEARALATAHADRFTFLEGYDEQMAHLLFAGADLYLMPSRFEPCGLTQMQAMRYGTIPVTSAVGGLVDTVVDDDLSRGHGTGFLAHDVSPTGFVDALHRAVRAWRSPRRRSGIQRRGMTIDWSWDVAAREYLALYESLTQ
jgi:starch synthase